MPDEIKNNPDDSSQESSSEKTQPIPPKSKIKISSEKTQIEFEQKMKEIKTSEVEKQTEAEAQKLGLPYVNLEGFPLSPEALALIEKKTAEDAKLICFLNLGAQMRLATPDPMSEQLTSAISEFKKNHVGANIELYLISQKNFEHAIKLYDLLPTAKKVVRGVEISEADLKKFSSGFRNFKELEAQMQQVSISDLVTYIIASAVLAEASDIHIEAEETGVKVRFRLDGILQDIASLQRDAWKKLNSRIKLLSGLKMNVQDVPQDGRFSIQLSNDRIDVRVSTLPTNFGESIVMRLLMSKAAGLAFKDLGLTSSTLRMLETQMRRPNGMIITTGPTGSGKTTTLYAIINELNEPGVKIITIEDPIEYQLAGINQSQVDYKRGFTFANGLKSLMRQDPDVIMVGEIRDSDTAEIAIQAALTGHMVISTLHTNSAAGAIPRFLSMGAKPFLFSPALNAVMAQRLARKLCSSCKVVSEVAPENLASAKKALEELLASPKAMENIEQKFDIANLVFYTAPGCEVCHHLGYKGRIGIYEMFTMNPEIEAMILSSESSEYKITEIAVKNGMVTMVQDGILKALEGITSLDEVFRVAE